MKCETKCCSKSKAVKVLTLVGLVVAGVALGGCLKHRDPAARAEKIVKRISKELDLSDAQKTKLVAVKDEFLSARKEFQKERTEMFDSLVAQLGGSELDPAALRKLTDKHRDIVDRATPKVVSKLVEFHASLNAEQKKTLVAKIEAFRKHSE